MGILANKQKGSRI